MTKSNSPACLSRGVPLKTCTVHPDSDLSEESKKLMRQYGGKI